MILDVFVRSGRNADAYAQLADAKASTLKDLVQRQIHAIERQIALCRRYAGGFAQSTDISNRTGTSR